MKTITGVCKNLLPGVTRKNHQISTKSNNVIHKNSFKRSLNIVLKSRNRILKTDGLQSGNFND